MTRGKLGSMNAKIKGRLLWAEQVPQDLPWERGGGGAGGGASSEGWEKRKDAQNQRESTRRWTRLSCSKEPGWVTELELGFGWKTAIIHST